MLAWPHYSYSKWNFSQTKQKFSGSNMFLINNLIFFLFLLIILSSQSLEIFSWNFYVCVCVCIYICAFIFLFQFRQFYYVLTVQFGYTGNGWSLKHIVKSKENRSAPLGPIISSPFYHRYCLWESLYSITALFLQLMWPFQFALPSPWNNTPFKKQHLKINFWKDEE